MSWFSPRAAFRQVALGLAFVLVGCPARQAPERGLRLVYKKTKPEALRATVDRRLAHLKVKANLSEDDTTLTVRVPEGSDVVRIKALVAHRGHLEFCPENATVAAKWCEATWPSGIVTDSVGKTCSLLGSRKDLESALAEAGTDLAWGSAGAQASAFSITECVSPRIVSAEAHGEGENLTLEFDRAGARAFTVLTTATVGRRLIIRLDGVVGAAPTVMEPITGGKALLNPGARDRAELEVLAAALVGGALPELELAREETWGPPSLKR